MIPDKTNPPDPVKLAQLLDLLEKVEEDGGSINLGTGRTTKTFNRGAWPKIMELVAALRPDPSPQGAQITPDLSCTFHPSETFVPGVPPDPAPAPTPSETLTAPVDFGEIFENPSSPFMEARKAESKSQPPPPARPVDIEAQRIIYEQFKRRGCTDPAREVDELLEDLGSAGFAIAPRPDTLEGGAPYTGGYDHDVAQFALKVREETEARVHTTPPKEEPARPTSINSLSHPIPKGVLSQNEIQQKGTK